MSRLLLTLALLLPAQAQNLELRESGKTKARLTLQQLKEISSPQTLRLDGGTHNYWAIPMAPVLEKVFGKNTYSQDTTFVFVCRDGYRSPVKSEELKKLPAFLAFSSSDSKPFQLENKPLGPYYLIWDSERFPERKTGGNWPYQVVAIDKASFKEAYSEVLPPANSSKQVLHGFAVFRKSCLSCHQINGQGGNMAIDLNSPHSVTEYIHKDFLLRLIDNPQKVRARALMPGLDPAMPNRKQAILDIVAYLEAKALQRRRSKPAKKSP